MARMASWGLAITAFATFAACAPTLNTPSTPQFRTELARVARETLSKRDRAAPEPPPCSTGWAEASGGYVVAVAEWAKQAGLRPGDQIAAVNGAQITETKERLRAYARVPAGGPFDLKVLRQGQSVTVALPCQYRPELFGAERRALEAASRSDWDGCVAAAREARVLAGFTAYTNLIWEHACMRAKTPSMTAPEGRDFASLTYETARLLLRDSRYVPGGATNVAEKIRQVADDLRKSGAPGQADDLEGQLQATLATLPRLRLTWMDNSTDEGGFLVERKVGETDRYRPLVRLAPNTMTYVDTAVQLGVTYCYRVRAFRASSYSDPSNEACAMPNPSPSSGGGE